MTIHQKTHATVVILKIHHTNFGQANYGGEMIKIVSNYFRQNERTQLNLRTYSV